MTWSRPMVCICPARGLEPEWNRTETDCPDSACGLGWSWMQQQRQSHYLIGPQVSIFSACCNLSPQSESLGGVWTVTVCS